MMSAGTAAGTAAGHDGRATMYLPVKGGMVVEVGIPEGQAVVELALAQIQGTTQTTLAKASLNRKELARLIRELQIQQEFLQDETIL
jgi:hypothetical protein